MKNPIWIRSPSRLIASVLVCNAAGIMGSLATTTGPGSWYQGIAKPYFTPPGWVFGPVWTTLYILMGTALYLVWIEGTERKDVRSALTLFFVQLALNTLWSFLFFYFRSPFLGFIGIILLWVALLVTTVTFHRIQKTAAFLMIPYICWVTFAAIINYRIMVLNG